jgi:hypothetical protein
MKTRARSSTKGGRMRRPRARVGLVVLAVAVLNTTAATIPANGGQERQYLVAGKRNALPDRSAQPPVPSPLVSFGAGSNPCRTFRSWAV